MARRISTASWLFGLGGLAAGLLVGVGMMIGALAGSCGTPRSPLEELRLAAVASHGTDTFAAATGPVDEEVEGFYTLDFLTGELNCFVINPRTGGNAGWFKTNIVKDLPVEKGKKPNYLLVTGTVQIRGVASNFRPALALCYVLDANTGNFAAYSFPWAKAAVSAAVTQASDMKVVAIGKARSLNLNE